MLATRLMEIFRNLIGKEVRRIMLEPTAVELEIDNTEIFSEFIYIQTGSVFIETNGPDLFNIGTVDWTQMVTYSIGVRNLNELLNDNLRSSKYIIDLDKYLHSTIESIELFWNKEEWTNYSFNEMYLESIGVKFSNKKELFVISGDYENIQGEAGMSYNFIPGSSSVIIFTDREIFTKYGLDKVLKVEIIE